MLRPALWVFLLLPLACTKSSDGGPSVSPPGAAAEPAPVKLDVPGAKLDVPGAKLDVPGGEGGKPVAPGALDNGGAPDTSYKLELVQPAAGAVGAEVEATVKVVPGPGYKMNKEFPTKLSVTPGDGVTVAKAEQVLADAKVFDPHQLVFAVKMTPQKAGDHKVDGVFKFAVCTDATCDAKKQTIAFNVSAK